MEFGNENCVMFIMKRGKRQSAEGIELLNQESIKHFGEKENYKYLEVLEVDTIQQAEMKEKNKQRVPQKVEKFPRRNPIEGRKGTGRVENQRKNPDHPDYRMVEIGQNTEKSPGNLRNLAVTPVKNHQQTLV